MPGHAIDTRIASALVEAAIAAPSMHNAQPWRFRLLRAEGALHVRADPARRMPLADPDDRGLHLGCGAALCNLRTAAADAGWEAVVTLLPDPRDPGLLAAVRLAGREHPDSALARLYPAVRRRHTSRSPFEAREVPPAVRATLQDAARREDARLVFPGDWHARELLELVHDAEGRDATDPGRLKELEHWTRRGTEAQTATDGVPEYAFGPGERRGHAPVRDFAGRRPVTGREAVAFEETPHLAVLCTTGDRPADWLRAGQAMERVLLTATLGGLSTALTSEALEWSDLRWAVRDPEAPVGHPQMVLRLGYGPRGAATPRRPVADVLDIG
ncbi:nitroreductase [Actinacidiphila glaucinigra]|uniref:Acg family FMN-binding oxidoreductase n=1 Tax=Actinacidiphila glaucinigra TaxID=235986 RepID=UPI002DD86BDB|nr:nitroreductase [Actinacidiphila glaucinigra]WSD65016.1 nitroreductase [Actinacidiphila glaucinigra]